MTQPDPQSTSHPARSHSAGSIAAIRTPDARFADLPDFPFVPHYRDDLPGYSGLRVHYLDEGPRSGPVFLCLHGQPSWSYLYRKMIPALTQAGGRVMAPDLLGFGRSDKPLDDATYSFDFHRNMLENFVEALDLRDITLVVQDWGGLLGLTLPVTNPQRYKRLIVMNTSIGTGQDPGPGFIAWRDYVRNNPDFSISALMKRSIPGLSEAEAMAYDAPFPDARYRAGARRFPELVMIRPDMEGVEISRQALHFWREQWTGQSFMAIGMQDPVLGAPAMRFLAKNIRNCPPPLELADAGHFVQEAGAIIVEQALESFGGV